MIKTSSYSVYMLNYILAYFSYKYLFSIEIEDLILDLKDDVVDI